MNDLVTFSTAARNAALAAKLQPAAGGSLTLYSGPRPAAGAAPAGTVLAQFTLASPCHTPPADGSVALVRPDDTIADADGTPVFARITTADGQFVADMDVGATGSGAVIIAEPAVIEQGRAVALLTLTLTED